VNYEGFSVPLDEAKKFEIRLWGYEFKPSPDITAYELALLIPFLSRGMWATEAELLQLPPECQRHVVGQWS